MHSNCDFSRLKFVLPGAACHLAYICIALHEVSPSFAQRDCLSIPIPATTMILCLTLVSLIPSFVSELLRRHFVLLLSAFFASLAAAPCILGMVQNYVTIPFFMTARLTAQIAGVLAGTGLSILSIGWTSAIERLDGTSRMLGAAPTVTLFAFIIGLAMFHLPATFGLSIFIACPFISAMTVCKALSKDRVTSDSCSLAKNRTKLICFAAAAICSGIVLNFPCSINTPLFRDFAQEIHFNLLALLIISTLVATGANLWAQSGKRNFMRYFTLPVAIMALCCGIALSDSVYTHRTGGCFLLIEAMLFELNIFLILMLSAKQQKLPPVPLVVSGYAGLLMGRLLCGPLCNALGSKNRLFLDFELTSLLITCLFILLIPIGVLTFGGKGLRRVTVTAEPSAIEATKLPEDNRGLTEEKEILGYGGFPLHEQGAYRLTLEERCRKVAEQYDLTKREQEVFLLASKGRSSGRIQSELFIAEGTVNAHLHHIYRKLNIASRQQMIDLVDGSIESNRSSGF